MIRWGVVAENLSIERAGPGGARSEAERPGFRLEAPKFRLVMADGLENRVPLMGPSGAGKSTLLNLLAGVLFTRRADTRVRWRFPDGFEAVWGGDGPSPQAQKTLRRRYFGFAFQSANLAPHLTVGQNLTYGLELAGLAPRRARERVERALATAVPELDPDVLMARDVSTLSGGQLQRVALVQSMAHDPYVLFADEPTGSLDPANRRNVMGVLTDWLDARPTERLLLWVTHHADDPAWTGAGARLLVADAGCRWQIMREGAAGVRWEEV